jgi:hypothetical protein
MLVSAVRRGSNIAEKMVAFNLTDGEAYTIERQMIGNYHKRCAGQLWNTIDERFMDPKYLPKKWSNPVWLTFSAVNPPRPNRAHDPTARRALPTVIVSARARLRPSFDNVTLTRGAAVLAVTTNTLALPFRPEASSSPHSALGNQR